MTTVDLSSIDLLALAGQDTRLKRVSSAKGGEWAGPCPFCGGDDRFRVQPHNGDRGRWYCRGCGGGRWHDAVDYVIKRDDVGFREALQILGLAVGDFEAGLRPKRRPRPPESADPPGPEWQARGRIFAEECREALWSPAGARALAWLHGRGLRDETVRTAGLGYNSADRWEPWEDWDLAPREGRRGVWLPRGIVIPWEIEGDLWRVNVRRPAGPPKYIGPAGFSNGLYNAGALAAGKPAILLEGELDVLTVIQEASDLVTPVATGATCGARRVRWIARLALCSLVLVAFDAEVDKGSEAARYWLHVLSNARRWRPYWEDVNQMLQDGADVRRWIAAGVGVDVDAAPATSFRFPDYTGLLERLDRARAGQELAAPLVERFEAVMDEALAVLGEATGCPDEEADRLLAEWDRLSAGYSEAVDLAGLEELSLEVKV